MCICIKNQKNTKINIFKGVTNIFDTYLNYKIMYSVNLITNCNDITKKKRIINNQFYIKTNNILCCKYILR